MDFSQIETAQDAPEDPFSLFKQWFEDAAEAEPKDPNAMNVATVDKDGKPSSRILLLKGFDENGFVFFTNKDSRKGGQLSQNQIAALCFYWKNLDRQIRIEGRTEHVSEDESDEYYKSRPKGSRIGAWASQQSEPLESRTALKNAVAKYEEKFADIDDIPRPPHWGGYRLIPDRMEFWQAGAFRLHTRVLYLPDGDNWSRMLLNP